MIEEKDEKKEVPKNAFDFSSFKPAAGPAPVVTAEPSAPTMPSDYIPKNAFDFGSSRSAEGETAEKEQAEKPAESEVKTGSEVEKKTSEEKAEPADKPAGQQTEEEDDDVVVVGETIESGDEEDEVVF